VQGELKAGDPVIVAEHSGASAQAGTAQTGPRPPKL
jgi:hypothetical protein